MCGGSTRSFRCGALYSVSAERAPAMNASMRSRAVAVLVIVVNMVGCTPSMAGRIQVGRRDRHGGRSEAKSGSTILHSVAGLKQFRCDLRCPPADVDHNP